MKKRLNIMFRILFGGALLFGAAANSCVSDALRDLAEEIEDMDNEDPDLGDVWDDIESWF
ncbi:MAG: hypothetical protein ACYTF1_25385 [Planctomycetota bacterium]|jgi:hypothetical protein